MAGQRPTVTLNGCTSASDAQIVTYAWHWEPTNPADESDATPGALPPASNCVANTRMRNGTYNLSLTIRTADGLTDTHTERIDVRDYLIVSIGDSYASGEGNPDVHQQHSSWGTVTAGPKWANGSAEAHKCHRSTNAASAQVALDIERDGPRMPDADPDPNHSSVTFVHLACSGATIEDPNGQGGF